MHAEILRGWNLKASLRGNSSNCLAICKLRWISPCSSAAAPHCKWQKTSPHNLTLALPSLATSFQHPPSLTSLRSVTPCSLGKVPVLPRCPSQKSEGWDEAGGQSENEPFTCYCGPLWTRHMQRTPGKLETSHHWLFTQTRTQALLQPDSVLVPTAVGQAWSERGCETSGSRTAGGPPLNVGAGNL